MDAANVALSSGQCGMALSLLRPIYDSESTDNGIRLLTASAYGCVATVNFADILTDFVSFPGSFAGSGLFEFLAQEFPSTLNPDDKILEAASLGTDALLAMVYPGTVFVPSHTVNSGTNNPGSLFITDRVPDSNSYLMFIAMAMMGAIENRYLSPLPNYHKGVPIPWMTPATSVGTGCAYSSALLNFYDSLQSVVNSAPPSVQSRYAVISGFLSTGLNTACNIGCLTNGCTMGCSTCPTTLRNRNSCTGATTDVNSCASAGLSTFVNATWAGPP